MTVQKDPLVEVQTVERVFYATGMMLDADDFQDEQHYHRSRLARALNGLHGYGTVSGLKVSYRRQAASPASGLLQPVEQLMVQPGQALDRLGRLIEVPGPACLRLDRWYRSMAESAVPEEVGQLINAFKPLPARGVREQNDPPFVGDLSAVDLENGGPPAASGVVVLDLFVRFIACESGKTPAFASGPFDATDAVQPSRLRDSYELLLVPRIEADLSLVLPANPWALAAAQPTPGLRREVLFERIMEPQPFPTGEYARAQEDTTAVLLARIAVQAAAPVGLAAPQRPHPLPAEPARPVYINNYLRPFLYTPGALAAILGV
jgi:hypothetical protein